MIEGLFFISSQKRNCSGGAGMGVVISVVAENTGRIIDIQSICLEMSGKQMGTVFEDSLISA